jgi:hypothetical protein
MTKRLFLLPGVFAFCAARALGRTAKSHKLAWLLAFAAVTVWAVVQDSTIFELDGDAVTNQGQGGHDWDQVYADSIAIPPTNTSGALAIAFIPDVVNSNQDNIFQGGGSKDTQGIQAGAWLYTASKPQGKDDLEHSYAAAYTLGNGDLGLYVGADRYDNSGDSTIAFWFFQSAIGLTQTKSGGGFKFSGAHTTGDLLLISDFTIGGSTSTIHAFEWQGDDATGSLVDKGVLPASQGFAIVNGSNKPSPWLFTDKSNTGGGNTFAPGEFFEGGVDLTAIFGGATSVPCFSTFMAETRSSQSPTATLSDFTPPRTFPLCGVSISKACAGVGSLNAGQNTIHYTFASSQTKNTVIQNTGIGALSHVTIVDSPPSGATNVAFKATAPSATLAGALGGTLNSVSTVSCPAGSPTGAVCADVGSIPAKNYVAWSVEFDLGSLSASNSATAAAGTGGASPGACTASGTVCSSSDGDSCSATVTNTVSITKSCGIPSGYPIPGGGGNESAAVQGTQLFVSGSLVAVKVNFSGTITNSGDTTLTGITVTDVPSATVTIAWPGTAGTLAPNASANYSGTYNPSSISSGNGTTAGRYGFTDEIYITGAKATLGSDPPAMSACSITGAPAGAQSCDGKTCNICFGGTAGGLCTPSF